MDTFVDSKKGETSATATAENDKSRDKKEEGDDRKINSNSVESNISANENSTGDFQGAGDSNAEYMKLKSEGNNLAKAGHYTAALEKYQEGLGKAETDVEYSILKHNKGIVYEAMKDFDVALEHYEAAIQLNPNYYKALKRKSKMLKQLENFEDARKNMTNVFLIERKLKMGKQQDTQEMWQSILMSIGINGSLSLIREDKAVVPTPTNAEVEAALRMFYCDPVSILWKKRPSVLNDSANKGLRGYDAAVDALHKKKYELIIPCCDAELAKCKSKHKEDALMLRGTFRLIWGHSKSALKDFTEVLSTENKISKKTKSSAAVKCALTLYYRSVDEEQMLLFIRLSRDLWEYNSDAYYIFAMIRRECHRDYDTAAQFLELALEYCPVTENDNLYRAELLEVTFLKSNPMRHKTILKDLKALEHKFDIPDCYYNYYKVLMSNGKAEEAFAMIEKAIALEPQNVNYLVARIMDKTTEKTPLSMASQLKDLRDIQDAIGCKHHLISFHIGCLELFLGNHDIGLKAFQESIDSCRSIFLTTERMMMKLNWEMDHELDKALKEKTSNYSIDPKLFERSKMYNMKLSTRPPLCTHCGRECVEDCSEDTDEDDE